MEKITKVEFMNEAKKGIYFFNSLWTDEINPLKTIEKYISKIDVKKYMIEKELRVLENNGGNLRFKRHDGSTSYLTLGSKSVIYRYRSFLIVYSMFEKSTNQSIVLYIKKDVTELKDVEIDPELFIEELPHGSGIDCEWEYTEHKNGKVTFKNYFHAMDEWGGYDGYMPFKFTVFYDPDSDQFDFQRLICDENKRRSFFGLKDYLEDTLYTTIVSNINPDKHLRKIENNLKITGIYDNEDRSIDRYTVVLDEKEGQNHNVCLGLSHNPNSPNGVSMFGYGQPGPHLGKKIKFEDLSNEIQSHIKRRLKDEN